jgi:predicted TIM-barrel fold metal-dependent hydrolase
MIHLKRFTAAALLILLLIISSVLNAQIDYLKSVKKIDVHAHIFSDNPSFRAVMDEWNFKMCNLATEAPFPTLPISYDDQREVSKEICSTQPRYYAWVTTFGVEERDKPDWAEEVIKQLKDDFDKGAVGVKVWKNIGMTITDADGRYIQIDDSIFTPILDFIAKENKTLIAHIGEPVYAWMIPEPGGYWDKHPEYCFYDKPELPSYMRCIEAMDHVLARHPNLNYVGAHMASLCFDVEEIIKRLDLYPNFAVEIGGRMRYLAVQVRGKLQHFFTKYQDRIMYGTDLFSPTIKKLGQKPSAKQIEQRTAYFSKRTNFFLRFLGTDDEFPWSDNIYEDGPAGGVATYTIRGLNLTKEVLDKVLYENAVKWFPGIEKEYLRE